jgi:KipI family sensor histidine kinase inhibitor
VRFLRFGVDGLLVEVADLRTAVALHDALAGARLPGVVELVPAARTVLVRFDPGITGARPLGAAIGLLDVAADTDRAGELVEIPVVYDGADLEDVAALTGLTVAEVVRRHTAVIHDVAFTGFAPGFAYLSGGDPALVVPRRDSPRTAIPAGSVGLAGEFSGVYPRSSPGGWQLLGRTDQPMWDESRSEPALLRPGMRVRFVAVPAPTHRSPDETPLRSASSRADGGGPSVLDALPALEVLAVGPLATVQDLGRPGHAAAGVSRSGAMDRPALRRANRLVGNPAGSAAIEFVGGIALAATASVVLAVTGAAGEIVRFQGAHDDAAADAAVTVGIEPDRPFALDAGERVEIGAAAAGVYGYVAVLGGLDSRPVLGSRSTDVLSGLGPDPLRGGDLLAVRSDHGAAVADAPEPGPCLQTGVSRRGAAVTVDVVLGPRDDWFAGFSEQDWTVTARSNRIGIRLDGAPIRRDDAHAGRELPSEAMVPGAIQVPPDGLPVVFAADHPVTGGYPVIATVVPEHLPRLVQVPPGGRVRFRVV